MRLLGISDLHVNRPPNRQALARLSPHPTDWLVVAGDVCEREADVRSAFDALCSKFARVVWTPGNHELWAVAGPGRIDRLRGEERYQALIELARSYRIFTPEDEYPEWPPRVASSASPPGPSTRRLVIAPLFLLYDYTFGPHLDHRRALAWAAESGIRCADEDLLAFEPYGTREEWCRRRCKATYERLSRLPPDTDTFLVNHFPLRREHAVLPRIPRFALWCGTTSTHDWHVRFRARVVVTGHLHIRSTRWLDGTRFEEVSLGYPGQWSEGANLDDYLRLLEGDERAFAIRV